MGNACQVVLFMEWCDPGRLTANRVMLCTRNIYLLENMKDILPETYHEIISMSGSAGIIRGGSIPCEDCIHSPNGKICRCWINCIRYKHMKKQKKLMEEKEYDFWQWYNDFFRADYNAPEIFCNG